MEWNIAQGSYLAVIDIVFDKICIWLSSRWSRLEQLFQVALIQAASKINPNRAIKVPEKEEQEQKLQLIMKLCRLDIPYPSLSLCLLQATSRGDQLLDVQREKLERKKKAAARVLWKVN